MRLCTWPSGRCSPIRMPSCVMIQATLRSRAATPIRNNPSGTTQSAGMNGRPPEAQVSRPGTIISKITAPEPAWTNLSRSEDPLRSRTSSGFAAASIVSGKHHERLDPVKEEVHHYSITISPVMPRSAWVLPSAPLMSQRRSVARPAATGTSHHSADCPG